MDFVRPAQPPVGVDRSPSGPDVVDRWADPVLATEVRPLSPPGRAARLAPFAAVAALGLVAELLPPAIKPELLAAATGLTALIAAAVRWLPWHRWPPVAAVAPAFAYFWVVTLLRAGDSGTGTGSAILALLPVLWVAVYHSRTVLLAALVLVVATFVGPHLLIGAAAQGSADWRRALLWVGAGAVLGLTIQHLVTGWRAAATALVNATEEMRRDRDFTAGILDSGGRLVLATDADERVTTFNRACEWITGRTAAEVLGRKVTEAVWTGADAPAARAFLDALRRGAQPDGFDSRFVGADGVRRLVHWR